MTEPDKIEPVDLIWPLGDWEEVRRKQARGRALIARMLEAQERLERAVDRLVRRKGTL